MFVEPPVLSIANPESPAHLLTGNGLGVVERDDDDRGLDALERLGVLGSVRDDLLAGLYRRNSSSALGQADAPEEENARQSKHRGRRW